MKEMLDLPVQLFGQEQQSLMIPTVVVVVAADLRVLKRD